MYHNLCWLCEQPYSEGVVDIAHVFAKADPEFTITHERGILPFSSSSDIDNAIPLCKNCHFNFDRPHPLCVFLPVDLEWFLDFERVDFEEREELLRQGKPRPRAVPTGDMYRAHLAKKGLLDESFDLRCPGGAYEVYLRGDFLSSPWERLRNPKLERLGYMRTKIWHGSPTAMLLHASRVLSCVNLGKSWIDDNKRRMLFDLILLWVANQQWTRIL